MELLPGVSPVSLFASVGPFRIPRKWCVYRPQVDHTPKDETLRIYTGNVFDLTNERTQTSYKYDGDNDTVDEFFSIKVRNHKTKPVEIRIVEHLYRATNWTIPTHSDLFLKTDANTVEFRVTFAPNAEKNVTYTAHYIW